MAYSPVGRGDGISFWKVLMYLALIFIIAIIGYNYYRDNLADYTFAPQEVTMKYLDADFKPNIDEERALAILSNPRRYRREFNDLIYDVNTQLLLHTAARMGLSDSLRRKAIGVYQEQHPYIRELYYNDFVALKDTSSQLYQQWYNNEFANAVEVLNEVMSKYTCFFINQVFTTILPTASGKVYIRGKKIDSPCGIAMTEGLQPMIKRLAERAAINDFSASKGMMEEKIEKVIAELATVEIRDKKGLSKQMQTKLLGFAVSSTEMEISAISVMKVGFKLDQYFQLDFNAKDKNLIVTLPEPVILSHEVYPKVDKLDIGWLREVQNVDLNKNFNALREAFRAEALESDVMQKSKNQATELMETMLTPLARSLAPGTRVVVQFKKSRLPADYNLERPLQHDLKNFQN